MKDWIPANWKSDMKPLTQAACENEATGSIGNFFLCPEDLREAVTALDEAEYFLEDITGLDGKEGMELIYHFTTWEDAPSRVTLRVLTSHDNPSVPTISDIFQGADWHERECYDFFGVHFENHPNLLPLLLPDNFGCNPLIKDESKRKSLLEILSACQTKGSVFPDAEASNPEDSGDKE